MAAGDMPWVSVFWLLVYRGFGGEVLRIVDGR